MPCIGFGGVAALLPHKTPGDFDGTDWPQASEPFDPENAAFVAVDVDEDQPPINVAAVPGCPGVVYIRDLAFISNGQPLTEWPNDVLEFRDGRYHRSAAG